MKERPILFSAPMVRAILEGRKTQTRRVVKFGVLNPGVRAFMRETVKAAVSPEGKRVMANYIPLAYKCPYGQPGDRLWVRETWRAFLGDDPRVEYAAGGTTNLDWENTDGWLKEARQFNELPSAVESGLVQKSEVTRWRPSIHMPRWASRITLEVVSVRVERVQDISESDAIAEGMIFTKRDPVVAGMLGPVGGEAKPWKRQPEQWSSKVGATTEESLHTAKDAFLDLFFNINKRAEPDANPWVWVVEFKRMGGT